MQSGLSLHISDPDDMGHLLGYFTIGHQRCITSGVVFHYCFKKADRVLVGFFSCIAYRFTKATFLLSIILLNTWAAGMKYSSSSRMS